MFAQPARDKGLTLAVDAAPHAPRYVEVDAGKLRQVLVNLLANAVKFTGHGSIGLHVHAPDQGRLAFAVSDTGVGISTDELTGLGKPFTQAQAGRQSAAGMGLGLAFSRSFVRLMGGELTLSSEAGLGTSARVSPVQAPDVSIILRMALPLRWHLAHGRAR